MAPPITLTDAQWRTYTPADGLAGLHLQHAAQDREGYLWFATFHNGVSRFDGEEFRTFTRDDGLPGNRVMSVLTDRRGRVWFASPGNGVCWWEGGAFHRDATVDAACTSTSHLFEDSRQRLWLVGSSVLGYVLDGQLCDLGGQMVRDCGMRPSHCWGIDEDGAGDIWFGMWQVVRYDGRHFHVYDDRHGLPAESMAYSVGADATGAMWYGRDGQLLRGDGESFAPVVEADVDHFRTIRRDRQGRTWFGSGKGAYCLQDGEVSRVSLPPGVDGVGIADVLEDEEGVLWFTTWGHGVARCDPGLRSVAGDELQVHDMQVTAGCSVWLGTQRGLALVGGEGAALDGERRVAGTGPVNALCSAADGGLWLGSNTGMTHWNADELQAVEDQAGGHGTEAGDRLDDAPFPVIPGTGSDEADITALLDEGGAGVLIARNHQAQGELSIARYDGDSCHDLLRRPKRFGLSRITCLLRTGEGDLWFGTGGKQGQVLDDESSVSQVGPDGEVTTYRVQDGLVDPRVEDMAQDRHGRLWVATRGGLSCRDGESFRNYTTKDGLPAPGALSVCEDPQGHLWFGTDCGVVRYDGVRFQLIRAPGLVGVHGIAPDCRGMIWCATSTGVWRYQPARTRPRVHLRRVVADRPYERPAADGLTCASTHVRFEFGGLSTRTPAADLGYVHRLRGIDVDWQDLHRRREVAYTDLAPGDYVFEVKAIDRDLNESESASCPLSLIPDPRYAALAQALTTPGGEHQFAGNSAALRAVQGKLAQVAETDLTVLILGETGTGKGLAARAVHARSRCSDGPLIQVNCGALPAALIESELFGHEKGAFTGATQRHLGKIELASGGTLFLDEIGDMSLDAQVRLLRLLEEGTFERVGGSRTLQAHARVIAATNRDLRRMVDDGTFRQDLYYRLQVFPVELPPLRDRLEDIPLLATLFMERMAEHVGKQVDGFSPAALEAMQQQRWPGNVRELEHAVQRAVIASAATLIAPADLGLDPPAVDAGPLDSMLSPEAYERRYLLHALEQTDWVIKGHGGAASLLDMPVSTLRSRMRKLGIRRP